MVGEERTDFADGDPGGAVEGEAIGAGADGGEGYRADSVLGGQGEGVAVAVGEQVVFVATAAGPDGADGVDHELCRKVVALGEAGFAGGAAADLAAFFQELRPRRAMDGAIDATAAEQRRVGRVHDRV